VVYLPPLFTETRTEVLVAHIERHDFGLLVSHGPDGPNGGLIASHIPFLIERRDGRLYLQGHLARANPQAEDLEEASAALAIFQGPHAYISPSWYQPGPSVPTWNYTAVHAYGAVRTIADHAWLHDLVRRLTDRHEAREPTPLWQMQGLPERYMETMLDGIVGFEIAVERLDGKFKLSQNRPAADRPRIIAALEHRDDAESRAVGQLMREREPKAHAGAP
jgi:transcriptional regulator